MRETLELEEVLGLLIQEAVTDLQVVVIEVQALVAIQAALGVHITRNQHPLRRTNTHSRRISKQPLLLK